MSWCFDVDDEQHKRQHEEDQPKQIDRQDAKAVDHKRQTDDADGAGHPTARAGNFDQDGLNADREKQKDNVGIGQ